MNKTKTWTGILSMALLTLASGMSFATESYFLGEAKSADGTEIVYETWGEGEPALVFIHGWSCDRSYWREQTPIFKKTHRVVAIDLAGHGDSGVDRVDYTMEAFAADVAAVLGEANLENVILIGHSMGGPVAVEAALAEPDRVRGIIGVDTFGKLSADLPQAQVDAFLGALRQDFSGVVTPWANSFFTADADSSLKSQIVADMAAGNPDSGISAMTHTLPWFAGEGIPRFQALQVNVTVVSSDLYPVDVEANREYIPGFEARILTGVGHFLMLEAPDEFNQLLTEAIAEFETQ